MSPPLLVTRLFQRLPEEFNGNIFGRLTGAYQGFLSTRRLGFSGAGLAGCYGAVDRLIGDGPQNLCKDELMACVSESFGRLTLSKSIDRQTFLPDPECQSGEVAVTGHQAESVEAPGIEKVHGVDNQGAVRRVLPPRVGKLLYRLDREMLQHLLPLRTGRDRKITIDSLNGRLAKPRDFGQERFDHGSLRIIGVNKNGKPLRRFLHLSFCRRFWIDHQDRTSLPRPGAVNPDGQEIG